MFVTVYVIDKSLFTTHYKNSNILLRNRMCYIIYKTTLSRIRRTSVRLRHIKGCEDFIHEANECIEELDARTYKGKWNLLFNNDKNIHIEIGMGKGLFIRRMAARYPDINFIGIEKYTSVLMKAIQRLRLERQSSENDKTDINLYYACIDAAILTDIFEYGEVSKIYLNFSDPWPKARHSHRRLTDKYFLDIYSKLLKTGAKLEFKTDNTDLFEYSLESIKVSDFELEFYTYDLHNEEGIENIMSEYEEKFSKNGQKICKLVAVRK